MKATRRGRRVGRGFRRTLAVGGLCIALTFGASFVGAGGASAQEPFSNGKAFAVARVARWAPGVGNLQLASSSGQTIAEVANTLAQAQAQTLDLGLIGTALTAEKCTGEPGALKQSDLPAATTVDNRNGDASMSQDDYPVAGGTIGGGREEVEATKLPAANARVSTATTTLGPLVAVANGHSNAVARVVDEKAREAEATSSADINIAGAVDIRDARWRAFHRTGADPATDAVFTVASVSAFGVPLPVDDLASLEDAINLALAPSGVTVELPHVEHITSPNDVIRSTPLRITLRDSPVGKAALGPVLNLTRVQREQLFDSIMSVYCEAAGALLVGDITVSVASGTGFMIVEVGGAEATSSDLVVGNPFGDFVPLQQVTDIGGVPEGVTFANGAPVATPAAAAAATPPAADLGPLAAICESLHPTRKPLCSRGMGLPVGVAGVLATGAIGYLDWRRQRRLVDELHTDVAPA